MAHYLVIAQQTATSTLLVRRLQELVDGDPDAIFTMLIPETHVQHALICDEVETRAAALWRAAEVRTALADAGIPLARTEIGCADPLAAVDDELRRSGDRYDAIVLSTFAPGISRWLHVDLPTRLAAGHDLPVLHVYPGGDAAWAATAAVRRASAEGSGARDATRSAKTEVPASPIFDSARDLAPILVLIVLHLMLGIGLGLQYSSTFFLTEGLLVIVMSLLLVGLWRDHRSASYEQ